MNFEMMRLAKMAGLRKDHATDREYIGDFDWRLFGDLIVEECHRVMVDQDGGSEWLGDAIKKHFGVE
jgi:hypothetical protein